ncbi:MAG: hypothetical protein DCC53_16470 [Chloroflexi bacterium]|nr:MAG: hypothetical protein DCC53_16470 [Chloroflexota bacterium]
MSRARATSTRTSSCSACTSLTSKPRSWALRRRTRSSANRDAAELGAWVIGVDQDEYGTTFGNGEAPGSDKIISSAVKRVDQGVYDMIEALALGESLPEGSLYLMDASVNGVGFAPAHDAAVPEDVTAQVQAILDGMAAGEIETGVDPVTGDLLGG